MLPVASSMAGGCDGPWSVTWKKSIVTLDNGPKIKSRSIIPPTLQGLRSSVVITGSTVPVMYYKPVRELCRV